MLEDKMVLWRHRLTRDVENGTNGSIKPDEIMHESLSALAHFLRSDGREWSITRVVCNKHDITPLNPPYGWYMALTEIPVDGGFLPIAYAEEKYSEYLK